MSEAQSKRSMMSMVALLAMTSAWAADPGRVVWDTPSADSNGTVPLGNGEIALNAWIDPSGDLRFFIARTDAWDEYGRLLKVGGMRVRVGNGDASRTRTFRQTLTVNDATLRATYGEGPSQVEFKVWVDANRPVVVVEAESAEPTVATATLELWRTNDVPVETQCSDVLTDSPDQKTVATCDTVLTGLRDHIGWYHRNTKSVGPELCGKIQGMAEFPRPDPLLHRTFGAIVATERPEHRDNRTLCSTSGKRHVFEIAVLTQQPVTAEAWREETAAALDAARALPLKERRKKHDAWWQSFWERSWIRISQNALPVQRPDGVGLPTNALPLSVGLNSKGGSAFNGTFGRVGIYEAPLGDAEIAALAAVAHDQPSPAHPAKIFGECATRPQALPQFAAKTFVGGFTAEAWIYSDAGFKGDGRIVDKVTPGAADGFLFDTYPDASLRAIVGNTTTSYSGVLRKGVWQHVAAAMEPSGYTRIYLDGKRLDGKASGENEVGDDASVVCRGYVLQRFVTACAGRGRYPIKFNGSLFTVPFENKPEYADYRRWGPGYWWQNTRLPYESLCASGDFDLMEPLFQMYARDLLPQFVYRTKRYLGHGGLYVPECIYFWGDMFSETYGWQPFEARADKLQASRWHKWEWVGALELSQYLLDRYDYTGDAKFLHETAMPFVREVLTFFDQHSPVGTDGKLVMQPSQALETWWECTNPMPEIAGLYAVTERCLALPEKQTTEAERAFWKGLRAKLPPLPTMKSPDGKTQLAPAQAFAHKSNCENPELYAVFPFRQFALGRPNIEWAAEALKHRGDRGPIGWRQEDVFMAYLGLAAEARDYVVQRARKSCPSQRFPAFWGPNFDWVPDQDHGGILMKAVQSMLLQNDGRTIYLLPAWPRDWDCEFKLHAPLKTVVSGTVRNGKLVSWEVEPGKRKADVVIGTDYRQ